MTDSQFDVFLSHNSSDKPIVRQLAKALQDLSLNVWVDEEQLVPGLPWQEALEEVIQTTKTAAVLIGKDGLGPWERPEMRACLSQFVDRNLPVIPVLLPGAAKEPELPLFLRQFTWVDLRDGLNAVGLARLEWGIRAGNTEQGPESQPSDHNKLPLPPHRRPATIPKEAWLSRYNFHDRKAVERLVCLLRQESAEPRLVYLVGEEGSGRRFFVEAAVHEARKTTSKLRLIFLDFDGYEDSENSLERYARHQATKQAMSNSGVDEAARDLKRRLLVRGPSLELCTIYSIAIQNAGTPTRVSAFLNRYLPRSSERLQPEQALTILLERLTAEGPLVLHASDIVQLPLPFVQWCGQQTMVHTGLVVIQSCPLETAKEKLLPGIQITRLEIAPLNRIDLQESLTSSFRDAAFAESLTDLLWIDVAHTRFQTGVTLHALIEENIIDELGGEWLFSRSADEDHAAVNVLKKDYWERLFGLCLEHEDLQEFLQFAALCGDNVPAGLLMECMGLDGPRAERLMDVIDEELCDDVSVACFRDIAFTHPAFGKDICVYAFVNRIIPQLLLHPLTKIERTQRAIRLLGYLEHCLPAKTRGVARLYLNLSSHLGEGGVNERVRWEQELAWWVGVEDADALRVNLVHALDNRDISPEVVWRTVHLTENHWPPYRRLALLDAYAGQADGIPSDTALDFFKVRSLLLYKVASFDDAKENASEGLAAAGSERLVAATFHNLVGLSCAALGQHAEALPHLEFFYDVAATELGEEHPDFATSCNNLAELYQSTGRYEEAEPLYKQALEIRRTAVGEAHPDFATSCNNLARLYDSTGRYEEAEPLFKQALEITRTAVGEEHPDFATICNNLAALYRSTGRYEEAEPLYKQALEIRRTALGEEHPDFATSCNHLAGMYDSTGRYEEAEPLFKQALEITRTAVGEEHPDFATSCNNLAELYRSTGRYEEAEPLYKQALEIRRTAVGEEHPNFATSCNNLAALYRTTARYEEAEPLYKQALEIQRTALGEEHPDFATSCNNLAWLYDSTGRYEEAEPLFKQAVEIFAASLGRDHPSTTTVRGNYELLLKRRESSE